MDLSRDNNYSIADNTVLNVTSLMECTDAQRLSLDEMSFGEFASTNVPTLLKGSRATVNGALFGPAPADGVPLYISNAAGSTFQDVSAAPAGTTLYLCLVPGTDTATYALKACASIYFNAEWRGWYETGTQNRVFGECRKVSGSWPVAYKRRYFHPSVVEDYLKTYSDGVELKARKIYPICNTGLVATSIYAATKNTNYQATTETWFKVRADYHLALELVLSSKTWCSAASEGKIISGCYIDAVLLADDGTSEVGTLRSAEIRDVPAATAGASTVYVVVDLHPGKYRIKLRTAIASFKYSVWPAEPRTETYGLRVESVSVHVRNVVGDKTGSWGAVF